MSSPLALDAIVVGEVRTERMGSPGTHVRQQRGSPGSVPADLAEDARVREGVQERRIVSAWVVRAHEVKRFFDDFQQGEHRDPNIKQLGLRCAVTLEEPQRQRVPNRARRYDGGFVLGEPGIQVRNINAERRYETLPALGFLALLD